TGIVAAALIGLVVGGGVVALVDDDGPRGRPGYSNHGPFERGPRGGFPDRDFRGGDRDDRPRAPRQAPAPPAAPSTPSTPSAPPSTSTTPS
ncbi:MAG: hypothetical protein ABW224_16165, partial [Kibdelosporangium sp.]